LINNLLILQNDYYVAPKEEGSNQSLARGKLFDRARNLKE